MAALTRINVELHIAGIHFDKEEWLGLIGVILMNPMEGLNSIKAAQQLMQAGVVPLLEDAAVWQLVLWRCKIDSKRGTISMTGKLSSTKYLKPPHEGTAVKVVRAAMSEHGVLNPPRFPILSSSQALSSDNASLTIPSTQASPSQTSKVSCRSNSSLPVAKCLRLSKSVAWYLDVSMQEDEEDENEDGDKDNLDIGMKDHPKVTEIGLLG
ncbi:hypothetical protein PISMIDRAFT_9610 [Pisolithus microcarpus 441]|uniref:Uncharacterized protein n=1 Tax=Pisolithus microcarpus 441 TaxID=765257 RepID=A0A0C9Z7Q6_9AGAM|nr:hypothetical protein BKA83DRAFT_9610 [Pisolithus microcarpus]KIK25391.1 hypothetical protein PISMIDRAFT_9610 [Pisolithus microcarpus 441]